MGFCFMSSHGVLLPQIRSPRRKSRDYADLLRSLRFPPSISICDIPERLASHVNNNNNNHNNNNHNNNNHNNNNHNNNNHNNNNNNLY